MKNKRNPMYLAIQSVLTTGALLSAGIAFAQDEDEDKVELERVVTTGTHIRTTDLENAAPVFSIDREDIQRTGITDVGDLLRQLPAAGASLNLSNNNGGNGGISVNLRNLGSQRVLLLVNGKRWVTGIQGNADLTNIPITIIERIDVLKDGASAIYGSDAIAGVINIITRSDFEGVEASAYYGETSEGDGGRQNFNIAMGTTSDRGSVFFNAEYTKNEPIFAGDRDISALPQFGTGNTRGSAGTPQGRFLIIVPPGTDTSNGPACLNRWGPGVTDCSTTPGSNGFNSPNDPDLIPFTNDTRFNFAPDNYLVTPQERTSVYVQGKYQLTDNISVNSEVLFNRRESSQLLAPEPLFIGIGNGSRPGKDIIDIGGQNPFNPFGADIPGSYIYLIGRRMVEIGNRITNNRVDTFYYGLGFEGYIDAGTGWDWSANYSLGENDIVNRSQGNLFLPNVVRGLSNNCVNGNDPGCVPFNIFGGAGTITQAMIDFVTFDGTSNAQNKLITYSGVVSSEIAELPAGPLGFALGYEFRRTSSFSAPDFVVQSGQSSGNRILPTKGAYTVDEFFVEFNVPLLSGVTGAQVLEFSAAARYSDYDLFGGSTNGKLGIRWKPIDDLLVRATYSEGLRAPNVFELFSGGGDSFPTIADPCIGVDTNDDGVPDTNPNDVAGQQGSLPGCAGLPATLSQVNPQIRITTGSNANLTPEASESFTLGLVYEPSYVDGLVITLDYYDIEITNVIGRLGSQNVLSTCASDGTLFCNFLTRNANGVVIDLNNGFINSARRTTKGVDFTVSYNFDTDYGVFNIISDTTYVDEFIITSRNFAILDPNATGFFNETDFLDTSASNSSNTLFGAALELPQIKSNLTLNWSYGDWSVNWQSRYTAGHDESCGLTTGNANVRPRPAGAVGGAVPDDFLVCNKPGGLSSNPGSTAPADDPIRFDQNSIGGYTIHDLNTTYHLADYDVRLTLGIENLFNRTPPLSTQAAANSYETGLFSGAGRFYWFRVNKRF